jgi:hypothetical protein
MNPNFIFAAHTCTSTNYTRTFNSPFTYDNEIMFYGPGLSLSRIIPIIHPTTVHKIHKCASLNNNYYVKKDSTILFKLENIYNTIYNLKNILIFRHSFNYKDFSLHKITNISLFFLIIIFLKYCTSLYIFLKHICLFIKY